NLNQPPNPNSLHEESFRSKISRHRCHLHSRLGIYMDLHFLVRTLWLGAVSVATLFPGSCAHAGLWVQKSGNKGTAFRCVDDHACPLHRWFVALRDRRIDMYSLCRPVSAAMYMVGSLGCLQGFEVLGRKRKGYNWHSCFLTANLHGV